MNTITRLFLAVFVVLVIGHVMVATAQSENSPKPAASPTPSPGQASSVKESSLPPITGTIKGRLVSSDGQPLTNASVLTQTLNGTPSTKPTRPDADGRFVFDDLAPGSYILIATAPGYIDESMALGNPFDWPRHLIGSNVKINMIRGGVITGR